jgi:hypothetical protein
MDSAQLSLTRTAGEITPDAPVSVPASTGVALVSRSGVVGRRWAFAIARSHVLWALSLVLIGVSIKFLIIARVDSSLPYYDQWDGEAADVFIPYFENTLWIGDFFKAHNEHRIVFSRVASLALMLLNGQWDSQIQAVFNALLHCVTIAVLGCVIVEKMGRAVWPWVWIPLLLVLILPFGVENTVWAFQTTFYLGLLFTLLTLLCLLHSVPFSKRWLAGSALAFLSLFTLATGFLASVAVALVLGMEAVKSRKQWRFVRPTVVVCVSATILGLLLKPVVPLHQKLVAGSIAEFLSALCGNLAWPCVNQPWLALLVVSPIAILAWRCYCTPGSFSPAEKFVLALGCWAVLNSAAIAWARGSGRNAFVSRYMDFSSMLMLANWFSILLLFRSNDVKRSILFRTLCVVWGAACAQGLASTSTAGAKTFVPAWTSLQAIRLSQAKAFLASNDEAALRRIPPIELPHPYAPKLAFLLRHPGLRSILPSSLREPLRIAPTSSMGSLTFLTNVTNGDVSCTTLGSIGSAGQTGMFVSDALERPSLPYLEVSVRGAVRESGTSLSLVDTVTGKTTAISLDGALNWKKLRVRSPEHSFRVMAQDNSPDSWFEFGPIRESGWMSFWVERILRATGSIMLAGCLGAFICFVCALITRAKSPPDTPASAV